MKLKRMYPLELLLILTFACVIPGLGTSAPFDQNMLSTIVVLTADAAILQTAVIQPVGTEIPAGTIVPKLTGSNIEQVQSNITKYSDYDGGFEVTFPAGWLATRPNYPDEFNASMTKNGANNPSLRDQMTSDLTGYEADLDRLYSYILRPDIEKNTIFGISKLVWASEDATSIDNASLGRLTRELESSGAIPGIRVDTARIFENGNAISMIEIGGHYTTGDGQGGAVPYYFTGIFFKPTPNSTTRITFAYLQGYSAQVTADVKAIIDSINLIGQQ